MHIKNKYIRILHILKIFQDLFYVYEYYFIYALMHLIIRVFIYKCIDIIFY